MIFFIFNFFSLLLFYSHCGLLNVVLVAVLVANKRVHNTVAYAGINERGRQPGGLGDGNPPAGSRGGAPLGVWEAKPPRS